MEKELNRETPLSKLNSNFTDNESFYKRNHFPSPEIDPKNWCLTVDFDSTKFAFALNDLADLAQTTVNATLECAGNGRSGFGKRVEGEFEWGSGAVGTAIWTGVPVKVLLRKCGITPSKLEGITEVIFEGADGAAKDAAPMESKKRFARSLPIDKVLDRETIVALRMNGEALPKDHGFPARLIVPGWYAMASVKWLDEIILGKSLPAFRGHFNAT
jgi:DMSO/TMAO reductase YedYZ molybdopterin-dependent catalytic subunit